MSSGGKRRGLSIVEALVAAALTAVGVAGTMKAIGSLTYGQAKLLEKQRMRRLAHEKFDELAATFDYQLATEGDFADRGESRYAWTASSETTGIENVVSLQVIVQRTEGRELSESVEGLVYEEPQQSGGAGQ